MVRHWRHSQGDLVTRDEVIIAVGTTDEVTTACRAAGIRIDQTIDLPGNFVTPGLVDAHLHTAQLARASGLVELRGAANVDEALQRVADHAAQLAADDPVRGGGWEWQKWQPAALPNRAQLDAVVPDRPVLLESQDLHSCWVNSALLTRLQIADNPTSPGLLHEADAWRAKDLLGPDERPLPGLLAATQRELLSLGLTGVHDMDGDEPRAGFAALRAAGSLHLRVVTSTRHTAVDAAINVGRRTGTGDPWLREGHVKVFADGALGSLTCQMCQPFQGTSNSGLASIDDADLHQLVQQCQAHGLAVATHAIGDRANQRVLDVYAANLATRPDGMRHRIEHAQHLRPVDVARFAALDVIASVQPAHLVSDVDLVDALLGDRAVASYAWASLVRSGALVAFGSDAPVERPDPRQALTAATLAALPDGRPHHQRHRAELLTPRQALWAHTAAPHRVAGQGDILGQIRPGQLADFVAWEASDPSNLSEARVALTVVGGEIVFAR